MHIMIHMIIPSLNKITVIRHLLDLYKICIGSIIEDTNEVGFTPLKVDL